MVRAWREPDFVPDQEGRRTWSDLHDVGPTPSGAKSAASRRDMAKILHLGVANPRWRKAPPSASLLDLKHFRSYHAPNHECRLVLAWSAVSPKAQAARTLTRKRSTSARSISASLE